MMFTTGICYAIYTGMNHSYSIFISLIKSKFNSYSFFPNTAALWDRLSAVIWRKLQCVTFLSVYIPKSKYIEFEPKYTKQISILLSGKRITFSKEYRQLKQVEDPFSINLEAPTEFHELKTTSVCKTKQRENSLQDFYKNLDRKKY